MELSILIPVFNWRIEPLLSRLLAEMEAGDLGDRMEVVVLDDASNDAATVAENERFLSQHAQRCLSYRRLEKNAGRSAIRNMLACEASGEFLLFLDCDVLPDAPDFIRSYLVEIEKGGCDVVCGGISYRTRIMNAPDYDYHAYLGNRKEVKPAAERNKAPWRHLLTSNIMIRKSIFVQTPFDERFTGYGYEDIEWGVRLAREFTIRHIDNTASHLGLVTKMKAYEKMCNSVQNYLLLRSICPAAFNASTISRVVAVFRSASCRSLRAMNSLLKTWFVSPWLGNRLAFIVFQLNFAVLLALALKKEGADKRSP